MENKKEENKDDQVKFNLGLAMLQRLDNLLTLVEKCLISEDYIGARRFLTSVHNEIDFVLKKPEEIKVWRKTRYEFNDLKKKSKCKECGSKERLEFHHIKPYRYNKFEILCKECHMFIHGKLLVRRNKNRGVFEVQGEK